MIDMEKLLVDKQCQLRKFPSKGGWTYTEIPEVAVHTLNPFGWVRVKGSIDSYVFSQYHLMPLGNGSLFLPVRAEIRKKIGKGQGDFVHVVLYEDYSEVQLPDELKACMLDEPQAYENFMTYTDSQKKAFIDWIYAAQKEDTRVQRIAETIGKLLKKQKLQ